MVTKIKNFFKKLFKKVESDIKNEVLHDIADVKAKVHTIIASIENDLLKDIAMIESKMDKIIADSNSAAINTEKEIKKAIQAYLTQLSTIEAKAEAVITSTPVPPVPPVV